MCHDFVTLVVLSSLRKLNFHSRRFKRLVMRYHLLISTMVAILLLGQPVALAQPTAEFQPNSGKFIISIPQDTLKDEEQQSNAFDWQEQIQQLQIATSKILEPVVATESINSLTSNFQSKLSDWAMAVNLNKLQESVVSNISTSLNTAQEWSKNLATDEEGNPIDFQEWATGLSSNLSGNLQNIQEWGTGLVANLGDNLFSLSEELDQIQQDLDTGDSPQELTEIQQAEQIATTLSKELNQIQRDLETGANPQELAAIQQAEQMAATLSAELNQIQQNLDTEANPQEIAEIQQAEQITSILSEELNEMQQAAETTAILSEELNELQEVVETVESESVAVTQEVADTVAVAETEPQTVESESVAVTQEVADTVAVTETESQTVMETETLDDLAEFKAIRSEEPAVPEQIAKVSEESIDSDLQS